MNKVFSIAVITLIMFSSITLAKPLNAEYSDVPFYVAMIIHLHQPVYDVSRNICDLVTDTSSNVYRVFRDRSMIYTYYVLDLIDYIEDNELPVNISIDITGTLIENLKNLSICAPTIPGLENYTYVVDNWTSRSYNHVEFLSTMYHYNLIPIYSRLNYEGSVMDIIRYGVDRHNETLYSFTNRYPGFEGVTGYHPAEIALDNKALELLARVGFNYTIVDDVHLYRIFSDYPTPRRLPDTWYTGDEVGEKTDQYYVWNKVLGEWIYLRFSYSGTDYYHVMNPYIGLRPHVIKTDKGPIIVFPRNRFFSVLMHAIMYFNGDNIDQAIDQFLSYIDYLQQYNTDPDRPFILVMDFDGDNGDPLTHASTWWSFVKRLLQNVTTPGSRYSYVKFVSPGWYLRHVYNPLNDDTWSYAQLPFIEPGSWNTDTTWGDPYLTKWIYPSQYSNEQKMLNMFTKALAYYVNAKTYDPSDPRLESILYWLSLASQSDWLYYPTTDWLNNVSYAVGRAITIAESMTTDDYAGPAIMFGWFEIPDNNYWPGLIYSDSKPWIKVHVWDISTINTVTLKVVVDTTIYTYTMIEETVLPGNYYAQITDTLPMGGDVLLNITATDQYGRGSYLAIVLGRVVDTKYKLDGVQDRDARVLWINTTNNDLKTLVVNDTSEYVYLGLNTTKQGSGYDTFVFISSNPSNARIPHPWNKRGYVPYYDLYIGLEESSGWNGYWMKLDGLDGLRDVLIGASWIIDYIWDPNNGYCEVLIAKNIYKQLYSTDRLFIGVAAWDTSDYGYVHEKLRMVSTYNSLYSDELIGIYLGEPYLKPYFTPDDGVSALNSIIEAIRSARSYIYIAMYNWNNLTQNSLIWRIAEEVINAKNHGVWVAVVVDGEHLYTDPLNYLRDNGIYVVAETGSYIMHNKFIVVDGVVLFTGSANLVDTAYTYIGSEYQYNDILEIHSTWFAKPYEYEFIEMRYKGIFHGGDPTPVELETQTILLNNTWVNVEFYFTPDEGVSLETSWNNYISSSNTVYAATYLMTLNSIGDSLVNKHLSGGDVKVLISYNEKDVTGTEYYKLISNRVPVTLNYDDEITSGYQILHHKLFIFDNSTVSTGSTNPTFSAINYNDENTVIIHWARLGEVYVSRFRELWNKYVAHITVKVYEGDRLATNVFVNVTTYDLAALTSNTYAWYNYTGYTNASGIFYVEAYLWNPNTTAKFLVNASTSSGWNKTVIYMGLSNNSAYVEIWITIYVKPVINIAGPSIINVGDTASYIVSISYPNGTTINRNLYLDVYVNNTYTDTILLVSGTAAWSYTPSNTGMYNISFYYSGGDWINGVQLLPTSNYTLLRVEEAVLQTQLVVTGPSTIYYGEEAQYGIELRDVNGALISVDTVVRVYVNGSWIANATLYGGVGSWIYRYYSSSGYYNITFYYAGGDTYNSKNLTPASTTVILEVLEAPTTITISTVSSTSVGTAINVMVSLKNSVTGDPLVNALVDVYVNNTYFNSYYTNTLGAVKFTYTPDKPGTLTIRAVYSGEPGKYLGSERSIVVNVYSGFETKVVITGPSMIYVSSTVKYRVELRYLNDTVIPVDADVEVYLNNTLNVMHLSNGVLELTITPGEPGLYNLTIVFNGGRYNDIELLPSSNSLIIYVDKRPVNIGVRASYMRINATYIYLELEIRVYDNVTGEPVNTGYVLVYINKTGAYQVLLNKSLANGVVMFSGVVDPLDPSLKVVYVDPTGTYHSGESEGSFIEIESINRMPPPLSEPWFTAVILLIGFLYISLRKKVFNN